MIMMIMMMMMVMMMTVMIVMIPGAMSTDMAGASLLSYRPMSQVGE